MTTHLSEAPLVTIITVTYNSALYVKDAIESVLAQDYENIEYIIGDDCSTDNTWSIISSYTDIRIKKYKNLKNLNEYPNRNKAINLAKGKYLIFIDGDDFIYPHAISFFVKMMEAFPNSAMAISRNYENNIIYPIELFPHETISAHYLSKALLSVSFVSTFFLREALCSVGGLSEKYKSGDDYIRVLISSKFRVLFINYGLTWHRETPGQASKKLTLSGVGIVENYLIYKEISSLAFFPLTNSQKQIVETNIKGGILRILFRDLLTLKLRKIAYVSRNINIKISDLVLFFIRQNYNKGYLKDFNPTSVLRLPINQNPFSSNFFHK